MMGKASQRKKAARPGDDSEAHTRIAAEAAEARNRKRLALVPAEETPALSELLDSAMGAIGEATPQAFDHKGRTYFLRVSFAQVNLMIFETATAPEPMAYAVSGGPDEFGHLPYH